MYRSILKLRKTPILSNRSLLSSAQSSSHRESERDLTRLLYNTIIRYFFFLHWTRIVPLTTVNRWPLYIFVLRQQGMRNRILKLVTVRRYVQSKGENSSLWRHESEESCRKQTSTKNKKVFKKAFEASKHDFFFSFEQTYPFISSNRSRVMENILFLGYLMTVQGDTSKY